MKEINVLITSPGVDVDFFPPHVQEEKSRQAELGSGVHPGRSSEGEKAIITRSTFLPNNKLSLSQSLDEPRAPGLSSF